MEEKQEDNSQVDLLTKEVNQFRILLTCVLKARENMIGVYGNEQMVDDVIQLYFEELINDVSKISQLHILEGEFSLSSEMLFLIGRLILFIYKIKGDIDVLKKEKGFHFAKWLLNLYFEDVQPDSVVRINPQIEPELYNFFKEKLVHTKYEFC